MPVYVCGKVCAQVRLPKMTSFFNVASVGTAVPGRMLKLKPWESRGARIL